MTYKLVYGLLDQGRDFKQELSGGGVNLKIFPEAEGLVTCTMEGVKPSSSQEEVQRNTRVGSGGQFTSNRLSNDHIYFFH